MGARPTGYGFVCVRRIRLQFAAFKYGVPVSNNRRRTPSKLNPSKFTPIKLNPSQFAAVIFYSNSQADNAKQVIEQLWGKTAEVRSL
jgi:hypothetical protein